MFLYHVPLQPPSAINCAVIGNFSGTKQQEIVVSRFSVLELLRPDKDTGKVHSVLTSNVFGSIRSLQAFRLTGASKDYIVVGSDSGRIVILEYRPNKNEFHKVHEETFGKSGCRRIVPGQMLAADPKGRAVMISAVEKQKLVYILNRDASANLTISSPLEAHKSNTFVYSCTGVDVGFENPTFACLEVDYSEIDRDPTGEALEASEKLLTYYELDLGLNHVVRKWSEPVDSRANLLISVPGGTDGPSGVLVCSENFITWKHQGHAEVRVPIPRRENPLEDADRGLLLVSYAMHRTKNLFFFLVQSEYGDLYKVTLDYQDDVVRDLKIKYFDTVPVASGLAVLRTGFLFVASEFSNHGLYQIIALGDDDVDQPEFTAEQYAAAASNGGPTQLVYFRPRPLKNLLLVDDLSSLCPILDAKVADVLGEELPQIYAATGRGQQSALRILRNGVEVIQLAALELPANPNAVWTVKRAAADDHDAYIVVSFVNATVVLSIGESVEEVADSGFLLSTPTLNVTQLGEDSLLQVYPEGIRHIRNDRRINEWKAPSGKPATKAAVNRRQVVLALASTELVYFELDPTQQLNEFQERKELGTEVASLTIGPIPDGRQRSRFLAVGGADNTVRILSLDPDDCLQALSTQALPALPTSLCMVEMKDQENTATLYLYIGLQNGVLLRTVVDPVNGVLSDTRTRFMGTRSVSLFAVKAQSHPAVVALSSRPWLSYSFQARMHLTPLSYETLDQGASFSSEQCPEGIIGIAGNTLRILVTDKLGNSFNQTAVPLKYTPRRVVVHAPTRHLVVIETDHRAYSPAERARRLGRAGSAPAPKAQRTDDDMETDDGPAAASEAPERTEEPAEEFDVKAPEGVWASCIRVVDPAQATTTAVVDLADNEAAFCMTAVPFHDQQGDVFIVVGTGKDVTLAPRTSSCGFLRLYRLVDGGRALELVHKTQIEESPTALCAFQGKLLVGMGHVLRIYDLGKKKLLRKCETKLLPHAVVTLHTQGDRIIAGDVQESFHYIKYKAMDNQLIIFADDTLPRYVTASCMLDYDTVASGDKFGNFAVLRLPAELSEAVDDDPVANRVLYERGVLNGAAHKVVCAVQFHVNDTLTSLSRCVLVPGGTEVLLYTTVLGAIGAFVPFNAREDVDFFQHLEMHMRTHAPSLVGRDHLWYRSSYQPIKSCVDGQLCEQYNLLPAATRKSIADELDRTPAEISKRLEDLRNRVVL